MIRRARLGVLVMCALLSAGCADRRPLAPAGVGPDTPAVPKLSTLRTPVTENDVVIATEAHDVLEIGPDGATVRLLAHLPLGYHDEVDAVDVSADGGHVLVSVLDDSASACSPRTYTIGTSGAVRTLLTGAAATFSPDATRIAYLQYQRIDGFCNRTRLVVRTVATGTERGSRFAAGARQEGNPPEWPVNWSPDGTRVAYVGNAAASVARVVGRWSDVPLRPGRRGGLAPVFLNDSTLATLTGCCTGDDQSMRQFPIAGTGSRELFPVRSPVRSVRRDRGATGLWFTTEPAPYSLWHWDGTTLRHVSRAALVTSG